MKQHPKMAGLLLAVVLSVFCWGGLLLGQTKHDRLTVYAGAIFFNDPELDSVVLVEFPFTLNRDEFKLFQPDSLDPRYFARIFAEVMLFGVDGLSVDSSSTYFSAVVASPEEAATEGIKLFNSLSLMVRPGVYSARVTVIDVVGKAQGEVFYEKIIVEPPVKDRLSIGGKCLAYNISRSHDTTNGGSSQLVKNGLVVLCNPLGVFGIEDTTAYFYAELYNLQYDPEIPSKWRLAFRIFDDSGRVYSDLGYKTVDKVGNSAVIAESFDIAGWPAGIYRLRITATDLLSQQSDSQQVAVTIVAPETLSSMAEMAPSIDPFDSLDLDIQLRLVHYTLTPVERDALKLLNRVGKMNFIAQYWREHDSDPATKLNETRRESLERYEFANLNFSTDAEKSDGWQTDRGRIYMTYGPWEQRDDIESPRTGNPFEVWYYHSLREGSVFVFEDRQGFHDYTLVHSNIEGERYSKDWEDRLRQDIYNMD